VDSYNITLANTLQIPIAKLGAWEHPVYKYVVFTQDDFNEIKRNFSNNEAGFEPYLRYGHSRYPGATDGEPATAFLKNIVQEGEILYGQFEAVDPTVVKEIREGKYRYSSAELTRNAHSKQIGRGNIGTLLTAVALTNAPFVPGLPQNQVLSENPEDIHFFVLNQREHDMSQEETTSVLQKLSTGIDKLLNFFSIAKEEQEQQLTASPMSKSMVYNNGVPMKKEEAYAMKADMPEEEEMSSKADMEKMSAKAGMAEEKMASDAMCPDCEKPMSECGCKSEGKYTASAAAPSALYKNGQRVKGEDLGNLSANQVQMAMSNENGGETRQFRAMPPLQPAGSVAHVAFLSQGSQALSAASSEQLSSHAAGVETPSAVKTQEEGTSMPEMNEQLLARMAELEQKFSQTVSALEAEKAGLQSKLDETRVKLDSATEQLSNMAAEVAVSATEAAELKLSQKAEALKAEGVPPVLVDEALAAIKTAGVNQKLSMNGNEAALADVVLDLLAKLPAENRVNFAQVGNKQVLSSGDVADNSFAYETILKERMGQ
jgi:hypothetical protein